MTFKIVCGAAVAAVVSSVAMADVRVIHASPNAPAVDIYVNTPPGSGAPALSNLAFTQGSPYVPFPTGLYHIQVTPAGLPAPIVIDITAPVNGALNYSVIATGFIDDLQPTVFLDDRTSNSNAARVRFINASPDAPAIDLFEAGAVNPIFDAVFFRSGSAYAELPGGSYDLEGRFDASGDLGFSVPGVSLQNGFVYTFIAMGSVEAGTLQLVPFVDAIPAPGAAGLLVMGGLLATRRRR